MKLIAKGAVVLAGALVASCAADPYGGPRQDAGAVAGAVAGGLIGSSVAGCGVGNRLAGAALGAVAGGILGGAIGAALDDACLLYTSPSPRDGLLSRMPSSA